MITLIGTNHYDPQGPRRLYALLNRLCPDLITVESSCPYRRLVNAEKKAISFRLKNLGVEDPEQYMFQQFHYEWDCARSYALRSRIVLYGIDDPKKAHHIGTNPDLLQEGDVLTLLTHTETDETLYNPVMIHSALEDRVLFGDRDRYMAKRINLLERGRHLVHIGGAGHAILPENKTINLRSLLQVERVFLLPDADGLSLNN